MALLVALGVDRGWRETASDSSGELGRVVQVDRGHCEVVTAQGTQRVASDSQRAQGKLAPVTGDWVMVTHGDLGPVVDKVLQRHTLVTRRDPAEATRAQHLVANADTVAVVHGLDRRLSPAGLERFLVMAHQSAAQVAVILAKSDLARHPEREAARAEALAPGCGVFVVSALRGDGLPPLAELTAENRTLALLGPSGVGKSTLVNALARSDLQEVAEVRSGDFRGRHTTTARRLVPLPPGGSVVDTPGIRAVAPWDAWEGLAATFAEISALDGDCKFEDCHHSGQPGCAVAGRVAQDRLERYLALAEELAEQDEDRAVAARLLRR